MKKGSLVFLVFLFSMGHGPLTHADYSTQPTNNSGSPGSQTGTTSGDTQQPASTPSTSNPSSVATPPISTGISSTIPTPSINTEIPTPSISTSIPSPIPTSSPTPTSNTATKDSTPTQKPIPQYSISFITPTDQQTFQSSDQAITVSLMITPTLEPEDKVMLMVDGKQVGSPVSNATINLPWLERGDHTLQAMIIQPRGNGATTPTITIFQQRASSQLPRT